MRIIIASDIFGVNDHLKKWAAQLNDHHFSTHLVSPYSHDQAFDSEISAYRAFQAAGGVNAYTQKLSTLTIQKDDVLLGFSAGAASQWQWLAKDQELVCAHLLGFYPGQIRHHLTSAPACSVTLFFPQQEPHFGVSAVINRLKPFSQVQCIQTPYGHGFMNPLSVNYSNSGATLFRQRLADMLRRLQSRF